MASDRVAQVLLSRRGWLKTAGAVGTTLGGTSVLQPVAAAQEHEEEQDDEPSAVSWPQLLGDNGHRNYADKNTGPRDRSTIQWQIPTSDVPIPIYVDGQIYAVLDDGFILSIPTTGRPVIQLYKLPAQTIGVLHRETTLFCNDAEDTVVGINDETGEERWRRTFPSPIQQPIFTNEALLYQTSDNRTFIVDPESGGITNRFDTPFGAGTDTPGYLVTDDTGVYGNVWNNGIFARSIDDGTIAWTRDISGGAEAPVLAENSLYFASGGSAPVDIFAITASTGEERWATTIDSQWLAHPVVSASHLFVGGDRLYALDRATGRQEWVSGLEPLRMVGAGETLYVITRDQGNDNPGPLVAIDMESGVERWRHTFDQEIDQATGMAITDAGLAVGYGNALYLFGSEE